MMKINFKEDLVKSGYILMPLHILDKEYWFIVDTGSPNNIIDNDVFITLTTEHPEINDFEVKELGHDIWGASQSGDAILPKNYVIEVPTEEGTFDFGVVAYVNSFEVISKKLGKKAIGLIGSRTMIKKKFIIDYKNYELTID